MELLTPNLGTFFWTAATFVLLLVILKKVAWGPILQTLAERETRIKEALEKAGYTPPQAARTSSCSRRCRTALTVAGA